MAKKKLPADPKKRAKSILAIVTGDAPASDEGKNHAAVALESKKAAKSRWNKKN